MLTKGKLLSSEMKQHFVYSARSTHYHSKMKMMDNFSPSGSIIKVLGDLTFDEFKFHVKGVKQAQHGQVLDLKQIKSFSDISRNIVIEIPKKMNNYAVQ